MLAIHFFKNDYSGWFIVGCNGYFPIKIDVGLGYSKPTSSLPLGVGLLKKYKLKVNNYL